MPSPRPFCLPSLSVTTTTRASVRLPREIRNGCFRGHVSSFASIARKLAGTDGNECDEAKKSGAVKKAKKKLNLSPERRAQLAAAMKARWAAKRAAEASTKSGSSDNQHSAPPGSTPHAPENRPDGV